VVTKKERWAGRKKQKTEEYCPFDRRYSPRGSRHG